LRAALLGNLVGDAREEPALVRLDVGESLAEALECIRGHISSLL
jgi:hypothetical protein